MTRFFRFPHTPHLAWYGDNPPRGDKILSPKEASDLLKTPVIVEEKLDGANLGISLTEFGTLQVQNRGQYLSLPGSGQFSRLSSWLELHKHSLLSILNPEVIIFGEWCAARHSLSYTDLPDWFVIFDVYDLKLNVFWDVSKRNELAKRAGLFTTRELLRGHTTLNELKNLVDLSKSYYRNGHLEGVVIRRESSIYPAVRAKLIRPDFIQTIEKHWKDRPLEWNALHQN